MSVLKYPARCETQPWQAGGTAVHMSAASVRIRADEVRHERTDARKTRWTASLRFVTASCHSLFTFTLHHSVLLSSFIDESTLR